MSMKRTQEEELTTNYHCGENRNGSFVFNHPCFTEREAKLFTRFRMKITLAGLGIIKVSFAISLLYMGVFFAVQGTTSPIMAAILIPISSITIMSFTTIAPNLSIHQRLKSVDKNQV